MEKGGVEHVLMHIQTRLHASLYSPTAFAPVPAPFFPTGGDNCKTAYSDMLRPPNHKHMLPGTHAWRLGPASERSPLMRIRNDDHTSDLYPDTNKRRWGIEVIIQGWCTSGRHGTKPFGNFEHGMPNAAYVGETSCA